MRKSKKYLKRKHKLTKKEKRRHRKTKNKKRKNSKRHRGGGDFPYIPQHLANFMWNREHGFHKMVNNYMGRPTGDSPRVTYQPGLLKSSQPDRINLDLEQFNRNADMQLSDML